MTQCNLCGVEKGTERVEGKKVHVCKGCKIKLDNTKENENAKEKIERE